MKPPPVIAFLARPGKDTGLEGAVLATEIAAVVPDSSSTPGYDEACIIALKNSPTKIRCLEHHEAVIRRWVDALMRYQGPEGPTFHMEKP